jgi:hypothetical protein
MFGVIIGPVWAFVFALILAVLLGIASPWLAAQEPFPQYGRRPAVDKGPRALGLVQLSPSGKKGRLIPIVIMLDGKYYDAGSFKAAPVPMALDFDTVYEAFRTGVSQGLFTITQPGQLNHVWIAEGTWLPAGAKAVDKHKKYSAPVIADDENDGRPVLHRRGEKSGGDSGDSNGKKDDDGPPVLRRPSDSDSGSSSKDADANSDKDKNTNTNKDQQKPGTASASPNGAPPASAPTSPDTGKASVPSESSKASASDENISDPNRPKLRRGKPDPSAHHEPFTTFDELADTKAGAVPTGVASSSANAKTTDPAASPPVVLIPAISDAGGPDPRPYTYDLKPAEEAIYRNKMLDLATTQLAAQASAAAKDAATSTGKKATASKAAGKSAGKSAAKPAKPVFDDVSLRVFDLSNSNEPVLVLSAKAEPPAVNASGNAEEPKEITLIARTNLEGELRKLFFSQTDSRHLDMTPRMELIDAVDADGDGRGELLFRRTFDEGSAYAIYRVTPDRLWPLFEGTP